MGPEVPPVLCWGFFNFGTTFNGGIMLGYFPHPLFFPDIFLYFRFFGWFSTFSRVSRGVKGGTKTLPSLVLSWSFIFGLFFFTAFATLFQIVRLFLQTSTQTFLYDIVFMYWSQIYTVLMYKSWDNSRSDNHYFSILSEFRQIQCGSPIFGRFVLLFFHFFACIKGGKGWYRHTTKHRPVMVVYFRLVIFSSICDIIPNFTIRLANEYPNILIWYCFHVLESNIYKSRLQIVR